MHLELIFRQSIVGVFTMMLDYPIVWNETVDKDAVLNYVFHHQHITRCNQVMLNLHHTTEAEMQKRTPADFFSYNIRRGRAIWRQLFDQGQLIAETEVMLADQTIIWVEGEYRCLYDDKGRIIGHVGIVHDVTNRKKAEQWSQYLGTVVDQISDAIVVTDRDCKIVLVNQATEKLFGYRQEELLGLSPQIFRVEPVAAGRPSHIFTAVSSDGFHSEELACRRKDGSVFICELRVTRIQDDEQGQPIAYVGLQRDVTEQRRLERAYKDSIDRFNQLARQARVYTWEVDASGLCTYISETVQDVIGYAVDEIVGKMHFYDLFVQPDKDRVKQRAFGYFAEKKPFVDFCNPIRAKDGKKVYISTNALPVIDQDGVLLGYRGSDRDITEKIAMQSTLIAEKELYKTTLMAVGDGVISVDRNGQIKLQNPAAEQLTGWLQQEAAGQPLAQVIRLVDGQNLYKSVDLAQLMPQCNQTAGTQMQAVLIGRSGKAVAISVKAAPIVDSDGQMTGVVLILRHVADQKDQQHLDRVTQSSEALARALGLRDSAITACVMAASLHELKETLFQRNRPLADGSPATAAVRPDSGGISSQVADAVLHQHERWNGSGQPNQLAGEEIPLLSRILAVTDSYDVMTSDSPSYDRQRRNEAMSVLQKNKGILFDPSIVQVFIEKVLQNERPEQQI